MSKIYFENAPVQETGVSSHNHVDGVHCARFKVQMINKSGPALVQERDKAPSWI